MSRILGVLPASGKASRLGGIPKFALPIAENETLISWHCKQMRELCDEVIVCTREVWLPLLQGLDLDVKLIVKEPSTMNDALRFSIENASIESDLIVGMPDTFMPSQYNENLNVYSGLLSSPGDIVLGLWKCSQELKGKVGQIALDNSGFVTDSRDKDPECDFPLMWGVMRIDVPLEKLRGNAEHPGKQINEWLQEGLVIRAVSNAGDYHDVGSYAGILNLYKNLKKDFPPVDV